MKTNASNVFSCAQLDVIDPTGSPSPEHLPDIKALIIGESISSAIRSDEPRSAIGDVTRASDNRFGESGLDEWSEEETFLGQPLKTREELESLLVDAGVRRTAQIWDLPGLEDVILSIDGEQSYLGRCQGTDLCGLLPPAFDEKPVWFVWLEASFKQHLPEFLKWQSFLQYGHRTSDPWVHGQFFELSAATHTNPYESAASIVFCATAVSDDLHSATDDGYITVVFQCDGQLTVAAYAVDQDAMDFLGSAHVGEFMNPVAVYGEPELQKRTRSIEDGKDSNPPWRENQRVLPVYLYRSIHERQFDEEPPKSAVSDAVDWIASESSAIGRPIDIVAHVPEELSDDEREYLRVTVDHNVFEALRGTAKYTWFKMPRVRTEEDEPAELPTMRLLFIRKGSIVLQPDYPMDDNCYAKALAQWKESGICPVLLENRRNGRCLTLNLNWPSDDSFTTAFTGNSASPSAQIEVWSTDEWALTEITGAERAHLKCTFFHTIGSVLER
ncbi:MAG: hypothetical protein KIT63_05505 [Rhodoferax sp.]|nr:hypothetical protein [Rhodoferax sp.]